MEVLFPEKIGQPTTESPLCCLAHHRRRRQICRKCHFRHTKRRETWVNTYQEVDVFLSSRNSHAPTTTIRVCYMMQRTVKLALTSFIKTVSLVSLWISTVSRTEISAFLFAGGNTHYDPEDGIRASNITKLRRATQPLAHSNNRDKLTVSISVAGSVQGRGQVEDRVYSSRFIV